jgi:hypothetical protein
MQANSSQQQRTGFSGLGLRCRAPRTVDDTAWGPWGVVPRAHGFHVSREAVNGTRTEALTNEVGRTKVFRKRELADAACLRKNGGAA